MSALLPQFGSVAYADRFRYEDQAHNTPWFMNVLRDPDQHCESDFSVTVVTILNTFLISRGLQNFFTVYYVEGAKSQEDALIRISLHFEEYLSSIAPKLEEFKCTRSVVDIKKFDLPTSMLVQTYKSWEDGDGLESNELLLRHKGSGNPYAVVGVF